MRSSLTFSCGAKDSGATACGSAASAAKSRPAPLTAWYFAMGHSELGLTRRCPYAFWWRWLRFSQSNFTSSSLAKYWPAEVETEPKFTLAEATAQNSSLAIEWLADMLVKRPASRRGAAPSRAGRQTECRLQIIGWRKFNSCFTGFFCDCDIQSGGGG